MLEAIRRVETDADVWHIQGFLELARFDAIGRAYVEFSLVQPGLFEIAFINWGVPPDGPDDPSAWEVLEASVDAISRAGAMDPRYRTVAPHIAWCAVHGLAGLAVSLGCLSADDGPRTPSSAVDHEVLTGVLEGVKRALGVPYR
jgi:hypothetical protein